ncbi:hypothetical protein J6590_018403 [Homalodisca vitripennis]|nr:hypothetical protein J6590_018403 [Homalodisca vitripennis]
MSSPGQEAVANSGYNSGDETSTLLVRVNTAKPVLMRQDCTTSLSVSPTPHLSHSAVLMGQSDESGGMPVVLEETARSVPDIELHCRGVLDHLATRVSPRCACRRKSSSLMARSVSRESVRSIHPPPPVLLTTSPSSRIIRQSSQPEATALAACSGHCCNHIHHHGSGSPVPSASLRQLREPGDGIAMIASESLRINGAIRQFKQVLMSALIFHRGSPWPECFIGWEAVMWNE